MSLFKFSSQQVDIVLIAVGLAFLKLLFSQLYHSTDFEVHRNWLAITHSLPLSKWYSENTSEWTLDYPPYFAYLEWALSKVAARADPQMLVLSNLNYASPATVLFQRGSVIAADAALVAACLVIVRKSGWEVAALSLCNFGLLIVDHIHFQYNGFLTGLMLGALVCLSNSSSQRSVLVGSVLFSGLLCFKHIYVYCAPAVFVYLLRHYCTIAGPPADRTSIPIIGTRLRLSLARFASLGAVVLTVLATAFGPFAYHSQLPQLISRLFPFKRGLCHAYWAPNFWALYNCLDKLLEIIGIRFGLVTKRPGFGVMTGGLVEEFRHAVLPSIQPWHTFLLTGACLMPILYRTWRPPKRKSLRLVLLESATLSSWTAFTFGWHVHEKAVLLITPVLLLTLFESKFHCCLAMSVLPVAHYSLFPLLFTAYESWIKYWLLASYTLGTVHLVASHHQYRLSTWQLLPLHVLCLVPLCLATDYLLPSLLAPAMPFLPLMLTSCYCASCLAFGYTKYLAYFLLHSDIDAEPDKKVN